MSRPNQGEAISIYRGQYILDETPEIASTGVELIQWNGDSTPFSQGAPWSLSLSQPVNQSLSRPKYYICRDPAKRDDPTLVNLKRGSMRCMFFLFS